MKRSKVEESIITKLETFVKNINDFFAGDLKDFDFDDFINYRDSLNDYENIDKDIFKFADNIYWYFKNTISDYYKFLNFETTLSSYEKDKKVIEYLKKHNIKIV